MKKICVLIVMLATILLSCHQKTSHNKFVVNTADSSSKRQVVNLPKHIDSVCHPKLNDKYYRTQGGMNPSYFIFLNDSVCDLRLYGNKLSTYTIDEHTGIITLHNNGSNNIYWKVYPGWKLKGLLDTLGGYTKPIYQDFKLLSNIENSQFGLVSMIYYNGHYTPGGGSSGYEITIQVL